MFKHKGGTVSAGGLYCGLTPRSKGGYVVRGRTSKMGGSGHILLSVRFSVFYGLVTSKVGVFS